MAEHFNIVDTLWAQNNFPSLEPLLKLARTADPTITRKFVKSFLDEKKGGSTFKAAS